MFKSGGSLSIPVLSNNIVLIGGEKKVLHAIDVNTGQEKWSFRANEEMFRIASANDAVYFRTSEGELFSINEKNGLPNWFQKIGDKLLQGINFKPVRHNSPLALYDKTIFFVGTEKKEHYLFAVASENGQTKWQYKIDEPSRDPIVADGVIYLGSLGMFYAIDTKSGNLLWSLGAKSSLQKKTIKNIVSSPAVNNGALYFLSDEGYLYIVR